MVRTNIAAGSVAIGELFPVPMRLNHYRLIWKQEIGTVSVQGLSCSDALSAREERLEE